MVPLRQNGAEAPRPTGGSPWPSIVHTSESTATREPRRYARRRPRTASRGLARPGETTTERWPSGWPASRSRPTARARAAARIRAGTDAGAWRHVGGARGLPEASQLGRFAPREERRARRGAAGAARPGRGGQPGQGVPGRAGGLREPDRATGDLACVREAARQRVNAILCRHGMSRDGRTPAGRPERRRCRHLRDRPRPVGLGGAGSRADCLAAPSAAESAEVACDELRARAEGIARAPGPGPPVVAPVRARGAGPPLGARPRRRGGGPLPPLVRAKGHVLLRPRALGELERREPEAGPRPGERTGARVRASRRGRLGPRAGQPGVPQEGRDVSAPRDPRARAGLLGKAPRTSQGAGLPRPGAPRGQHRHGRRDGAHAALHRQGRAGGRRAGGRGGPRRLSNGQRAMSNEQ